jgi:hypothetical protein
MSSIGPIRVPLHSSFLAGLSAAGLPCHSESHFASRSSGPGCFGKRPSASWRYPGYSFRLAKHIGGRCSLRSLKSGRLRLQKRYWRESMPLSTANIGSNTQMGVTLVPSGATFEVWAPLAQAVYLNGEFGRAANWTKPLIPICFLTRMPPDTGRVS